METTHENHAHHGREKKMLWLHRNHSGVITVEDLEDVVVEDLTKDDHPLEEEMDSEADQEEEALEIPDKISEDKKENAMTVGRQAIFKHSALTRIANPSNNNKEGTTLQVDQAAKYRIKQLETRWDF